MMTTAHSFECTRTNVAGAIYYLTDMVMFEEYKSLTDNLEYLCVTITKDDETTITTSFFEYKDVPDYVMDIYKYVAGTSRLVPDSPLPGCYKLYGNHIGRVKDYQMHLASYAADPLDAKKLHILQFNANCADDDFIKEICETMKIVKKLEVV
jgi:hypothetical protein